MGPTFVLVQYSVVVSNDNTSSIIIGSERESILDEQYFRNTLVCCLILHSLALGRDVFSN